MDTKMRHIVGAILTGLSLAVLLLILRPAANAHPVAESLPPLQPAALLANGVITGVITGDDTAAPLADVEVCANGEWPYLNQCTYTNASGVYSVSVPAGSYQVRFWPADYHVGEYYDDVPNPLYSSCTPVVVADDAVTPNINASLAAGMQISGRVTDEATANRLAGISIYVNEPGGDYYAYGYTGADGVYTTTPGLPTGAYWVQFADYGGVYATEYYTNAYRPGQATSVSLTSASRTDVDTALAHAAVITGVVTGPNPLSSITVYAYFADENTYANSTNTDAGGIYRLTGLAPISYKLWFYDYTGQHLSEWHLNKPNWNTADPIPLTSGMTTTINADLAQAGVLSGTVTAEGSGAPLANIHVRTYDAATGNSVNSDYTDAGGIYYIGGLASGAYKLRFRDDHGVYLTEYYDNKPTLASADLVTVTAGMTTTVDAALAPAGVLNGVVTEAGTGLPLADIDVNVYDALTDNYINDGDSDTDGFFRVGGLRSGAYKLYFRDRAGAHLGEYYDDKFDLSSADLITVTSGLTTSIAAALGHGGRITGRVTDVDSGAGLAGVSVSVERQDGGSPSGSATTDATGHYTTSALYTGVYQVNFSPPPPYYSEDYDGFRQWDSFTPVTVTAPLTTTGIHAALRAGYLITGSVTGPGPLQDVYVSAYRAADSYSWLGAYTSSDGAYRLGPLDPGDYRVYFQSNDWHAGEWYSESGSYRDSAIIPVADDVPNINASLEGGGRITGAVTGAGGAPLPDVWVYVYPVGNSSSVASGETDAAGHYVTGPGLPTGEYQLKFSAPLGHTTEWYNDQASQTTATRIAVTAGITATGVDAQLSAYAWGVITGTVTAADTGRPLNTWVYAYNSQGDSVRSDYTSGGVYVLDYLPADVYRVYFSSPPAPYIGGMYYAGKSDFASADRITVTAGITVPYINQALPRGGSITGTVTKSGSGGLSGVYVYAKRVTGNWASESTYTGIDGAYRLEGLPDGGYKVQFSPPAPFIGEWYADAGENTAQIITVTHSATTANVNATLAAGGVITGLVTAADTGMPLAGAYVNVYSVAGAFIAGAYTGRDGGYLTPGLPAGDYWVSFDTGPWLYYRPEWYTDAHVPGDRITVTVPTLGAAPHINAALDRGGSISGWTYSKATGQTLNDVYVVAYRAPAHEYINYDYSNNWGFYQITGLPDDHYKVYFSKSGYKAQWYNQAVDVTSALTVTVNAPDDLPNVNAYLRYAREVYLPIVMRNKS